MKKQKVVIEADESPIRAAWAKVSAAASVFSDAVFTLSALALGVLIAGFGLMTAGVFSLFGSGWALVFAGAACVLFAVVTLRGITE